MSSADWYFAQADIIRGRADVCLRLARRLDGATLFDLHKYSGEATWQGPVAIEFDEQLALHCSRLRGAIDQLQANAVAFSCEADDLERRGAYIVAQQLAGG